MRARSLAPASNEASDTNRVKLRALPAAQFRRADDERPCECGDSRCRSTIPASAEQHRGGSERVIVDPLHVGFGTIVRIADRFIVVDTAGQEMLSPWKAVPRSGRRVAGAMRTAS